MVMGTNPLLLLDELRGLGSATVTALTDNIPPLEALVPSNCHLGRDGRLTTSTAEGGDRRRLHVRYR